MAVLCRRSVFVIFLCLLRSSDAQCLKSMSQATQTCSFEDDEEAEGRLENDLSQCFDDCLGTSIGDDCKTVEWNPKEGKCMAHKVDVTSIVSGDCVVFRKVTCSEITDYRCQKTLTNAVFSKTRPVPHVRDIKTCAMICQTMGLHCKGYQWVETSSTCRFASGRLDNRRQPEEGHVLVHLDSPDCDKRCYLLRNNALTKGAMERQSISHNLIGCLNIMRNERKPRIDWDGWSHKCWVHNTLEGNVEYWKYPLHQFLNFCKLKQFKKVCLQKYPGRRMLRGLVIRDLTKEADCVDICSNTRNCVAVDWSVLEVRCYLHQFRVNIIHTHTFNHYEPVSSCDELKDTSLIDNSPQWRSNNHFVKSTSFKAKVDNTQAMMKLLSRVRCAVHCHITTHCRGFTYALNTNRCYLGFHGDQIEYVHS